MQPLSPGQRRTYDAIVSHWREHAEPPTLRDLMAAMEIRSTNGVACHVNAMRKKGWLVAGTTLLPVNLVGYLREAVVAFEQQHSEV